MHKLVASRCCLIVEQLVEDQEVAFGSGTSEMAFVYIAIALILAGVSWVLRGLIVSWLELLLSKVAGNTRPSTASSSTGYDP